MKTMQRRKPWRFGKNRVATVSAINSSLRRQLKGGHRTLLDCMETRAAIQPIFRRRA